MAYPHPPYSRPSPVHPDQRSGSDLPEISEKNHFYLHISEICCNFAPKIYAGGICLFVKGGFSDILIAFIDALCLANRNFATFVNLESNQSEQ